MKLKWPYLLALLWVLLSTLSPQLAAGSLGTAFTYQGRLGVGINPASGIYDFRFTIYDAGNGGNPVGSTFATNGVTVTGGLFAVALDCGSGVFTGDARWLAIEVRTNGGASFTTLSPRQPLTPMPYASYAPSAGTAAMALNVLPSADLTGARLNIGSGNVLNGSWSTISGGQANTVQARADNSTISGGGANTIQTSAASSSAGWGGHATVAGGYGNSIGAAFATIGGGWHNTIQPDTQSATIGGGFANTIQTLAWDSSIGGGANNTISNEARHSTIAGGWLNAIQGQSQISTIGGGYGNTIQNSAAGSAIGGGNGNSIQSFSSASTISGGEGNVIQRNAPRSAIGGGGGNAIQTNSPSSTIGGGVGNIIQQDASGSTISGGQNNVSGAMHSTIGGGWNNTIQPDTQSATIGGGFANTIQTLAWDSSIGGGANNTISNEARNSIIAGGWLNTLQLRARFSSIGGGQANTIQSYSECSMIGGGWGNTIQDSASGSAIGGGSGNTIQSFAFNSTIAGGAANIIQTSASGSTIAGGWDNTIESAAELSTIAGGRSNRVAGSYAFAAGYRAKANHSGTFVWADSTGADFASTGSNQFLIRASGGVGINTTNLTADLGLDSDDAVFTGWDLQNRTTATGATGYRCQVVGSAVSGRQGNFELWKKGSNLNLLTLQPGGNMGIGNTNPTNKLMVVNARCDGTSWINASDRNLKEHFAPVDAEEVLAKLAQLPISRWNYKGDTGTPHLGPMAQDFKAAFGLGPDDTSIATVDADGVALAAIQGLNQKLEDRGQRSEIRSQRLEQELQQKQTEITELKQELAELKALVKTLAEQVNGGTQ